VADAEPPWALHVLAASENGPVSPTFAWRSCPAGSCDDAYAYVALARTKKLMISYRVGKRDEAHTKAFIADLRTRLVTIPELSTDGWQSYPIAVGQSFGGAVDHAISQKNYTRKGRSDGPKHDHRYEPPRDLFITKQVAHGAPNLDRASTSHVERLNLTTRMHIRRFTRLCNGFSKKIENHRAAVSLHVAWYNYCRIHESLHVTPAMEAGITDHVWTIEELVTRALSAEPCAAPESKPLALSTPQPNEKNIAARELPNGRGWLRALLGGKGKGKPNDPPRGPTPPRPVRIATPLVDDYDKHRQETLRHLEGWGTEPGDGGARMGVTG